MSVKIKTNIIGETVAKYPNFEIVKIYREEGFFPQTALSYGVDLDTMKFRELVGFGIVKNGVLDDKGKNIIVFKKPSCYHYQVFYLKPTEWQIKDLSESFGAEIVELYDVTLDKDFNIAKKLVTYDPNKDKYDEIMKKIEHYYKGKYIQNKAVFYFEHKEEIDNLPDIS
jgi:hypothetical protein